MEKVIWAFLAFLLVTCNEEKLKTRHMVVSNSNPVQFWINGEETFNEKDVCGITKVCWCQPFNCNDNIRVQVSDLIDSDYFLSMVDKDGALLGYKEFDKTQINNYFIDEPFADDLDGWAGGSYGILHKTENWSWIGGLAVSDVSQVGGTIKHTYILSEDFPIPAGQHYLNIYYELENSASDEQTVTLQLFLINAGTVVQTIDVDVFEGQSIGYTKQISNFAFTADVDYETIGVGFIYSANALTIDVRIGRTQVGDLSNIFYDVSFVPNDLGLCDASVGLVISTDAPSEDVVYPTPVETWVSLPGSPTWTVDPDGAHTTLSAGETTTTLFIPVEGIEIGDSIKVFLDLIASLPATASHIQAAFYGAAPMAASNTVSVNTILTDNLSTSSFVITGSVTEIRISLTLTTAPATPIVYLLNENLRIYKAAGTTRGPSDCLGIKTSNPCTVPIQYRNRSDFDDLNFPDSSPETYFTLRIPAVFFHEDNPVTQEDIELSNSNIVRLYTKVEGKRLLQIGMMPHYMHTKLLLVLSSDEVIIDGKDWLLRDEYQKNPGNLKYPLKTAQVWLTDKSFVKENQLS